MFSLPGLYQYIIIYTSEDRDFIQHACHPYWFWSKTCHRSPAAPLRKRSHEFPVGAQQLSFFLHLTKPQLKITKQGASAYITLHLCDEIFLSKICVFWKKQLILKTIWKPPRPALFSISSRICQVPRLKTTNLLNFGRLWHHTGNSSSLIRAAPSLSYPSPSKPTQDITIQPKKRDWRINGFQLRGAHNIGRSAFPWKHPMATGGALTINMLDADLQHSLTC